MDWVYLLVAGAFEIVWASSLKYTDGFTRLWPSVGTVATMSVSMVCLALASRTIPIGTAYSIWTGIGAVGTTIMGVALFNEPRDLDRLFFIFVIIAGIAGLKLSSPA
jgi:quaternary ammonium compound-resistance protein SugE